MPSTDRHRPHGFRLLIPSGALFTQNITGPARMEKIDLINPKHRKEACSQWKLEELHWQRYGDFV